MMTLAYYNENDPFAAKWLIELIADGLIAPGIVDSRDMQDVRPADLKGFTQCHFFAGIGIWSLAARLAGWPDDRPIWTGSCPCQPFSTAGKGAGFDDERHLWPAWYWLITNAKPDDVPVLGEQVASKAGRAWFDLVSSDMEALAHACGAVDISAAGFGAPFIGQRLYWLAASDDARSQGRITAERSRCSDQRAVGPDGVVDRLAASDQQRHATIQQGRAGSICDEGQIQRAQHRHECSNRPVAASNRNINGGIPLHPVDYWRNAEWLLCRDPNGARFRPVEPSHVIMVNVGAVGGNVAGSSGAGSEDEQTQTAMNDEELQTVRQNSGAQNIPVRSDRIVVDSGASSVLQSTMHGGLATRSHQSHEPEEQQASIGTVAETNLRDVRQSEKTDACSSSRREPVQQYTEQSPDVVRFMSHALTLAQLRRDHATTDALQALRQAILSKGIVQHSSDTLETVWRSLSDADQKRIRLDHSFNKWKTVTPFPLAEKGEYLNRVDEVRGAGNSLNVSQAQVFIEAVMEYLG